MHKRMKRRIVSLKILTFVTCLLLLVGCGDKKDGNHQVTTQDLFSTEETTTQSVVVVPEENRTTEATTELVIDSSVASSTDGELDNPNEATLKNGDIDLDLTLLSSTMVYSEVYNIMTTPEKYIGKTIRVTGPFDVYQDAETGNTYFACIIEDATACCAQGMEFVLEGQHSYPEDYPPIGTYITIQGNFNIYEEGGYKYMQLVNASMEMYQGK